MRACPRSYNISCDVLGFASGPPFIAATLRPIAIQFIFQCRHLSKLPGTPRSRTYVPTERCATTADQRNPKRTTRPAGQLKLTTKRSRSIQCNQIFHETRPIFSRISKQSTMNHAKRKTLISSRARGVGLHPLANRSLQNKLIYINLNAGLHTYSFVRLPYSWQSPFSPSGTSSGSSPPAKLTLVPRCECEHLFLRPLACRRKKKEGRKCNIVKTKEGSAPSVVIDKTSFFISGENGKGNGFAFTCHLLEPALE